MKENLNNGARVLDIRVLALPEDPNKIFLAHIFLSDIRLEQVL